MFLTSPIATSVVEKPSVFTLPPEVHIRTGGASPAVSSSFQTTSFLKRPRHGNMLNDVFLNNGGGRNTFESMMGGGAVGDTSINATTLHTAMPTRGVYTLPPIAPPRDNDENDDADEWRHRQRRSVHGGGGGGNNVVVAAAVEDQLYKFRCVEDDFNNDKDDDVEERNKPPPSQNDAAADATPAPFFFDVNASDLTAAFHSLVVGKHPDDDEDGNDDNDDDEEYAATAPSGCDEWGVPLWPSPSVLAQSPPPAPPVYHRTRDGIVMLDGMDLKEHQIQSRRQMHELEVRPHRGTRGMIDSKEMGMGKTVCVLSMAAADKDAPAELWERRADDDDAEPDIAILKSRATLVVCPLTLVRQWISEVRKFFGAHLRVMVLREDYLGKKRWNGSLSPTDVLAADIVITSYETVTQISKMLGISGRVATAKAKEKAAATTDDVSIIKKTRTKKEKPPLTDDQHRALLRSKPCCGAPLLMQIEWQRIVADESQRLANPKSLLFESMSALQSRYRQCLTGTPFKNYDVDVWAQYRWLGYRDTPKASDWSEQRSLDHEMHKCIQVMSYQSENIPMPSLSFETVMVDLEDPNELCAYQLLFMLGRTRLRARRRAMALVILTYLRQLCIAPCIVIPGAMDGLGDGFDPDKAAAVKVLACSNATATTEAFHPELRAAGMSSPFLVLLGASICKRDDLVDIMQLVLTQQRNRAIAISNNSDSTTTTKTTSSAAAADALLPLAEPVSVADAETRLGELERWIYNVDGTAGTHSTKIRRMCERIAHLVLVQGRKVIVFSAFVKALRILRYALNTATPGMAGRRIAWMTGDTNDKIRDSEVDYFQNVDGGSVLMMGYKVGAMGLNLTESRDVIFMDGNWNGTDEDQGVHRAWRIGQTQDVVGHRFMVRHSVEVSMQLICERKRQEAARMINGGCSGGGGGATAPSQSELDTIMSENF